MIAVQNTYISDDVAEKMFVCDLQKCKGACCVEGDLGAPLQEEDELDILKEIYPFVKPYLTPEAIEVAETQGLYIKDYEGDFSTTTVNGKECIFAIYDEKKVLKCGIEQAYRDGKITFAKPISCHLYPIRITKYEDFDAINYHRWEICSPACSLGESLKVPVYQFLKEPLIRKYGQEWYQELSENIEENQKK
jgi:hypothetical protein